MSGLKANDENGNVSIPDARPNVEAVRAIAKEALGSNKGAGWSARLFEECEPNEMPVTVTNFLSSVFAQFPPPSAVDDEAAPELPAAAA